MWTPILVLSILGLLVPCSPAGAPSERAPDLDWVPVHVRVDKPDGKPMRNREALRLAGTMSVEEGPPVKIYPCPAETLGAGWHSYSVPAGSQLQLAVWLPGYALIEAEREIPGMAVPRARRSSRTL